MAYLKYVGTRKVTKSLLALPTIQFVFWTSECNFERCPIEHGWNVAVFQCLAVDEMWEKKKMFILGG